MDNYDDIARNEHFGKYCGDNLLHIAPFGAKTVARVMA